MVERFMSFEEEPNSLIDIQSLERAFWEEKLTGTDWRDLQVAIGIIDAGNLYEQELAQPFVSRLVK